MRRSSFAAGASLANNVAAEGRIESKMDGIMNCLVYELHEDTKSVEVIKVDDFGRADKYTSLFEQAKNAKNFSTEFTIDIPARISDDDLCKRVKAVLVRNIGIKEPWIIQANVIVRPEQKNITRFEYRNLRSAFSSR